MNTCQPNIDLCITQEDEKAYDLTFTTDGTTPLDITGSTVSFTARADIGGDIVMSKSVTTHTDPTNGKTTVSLSSGDTNIPLGPYYYDIQVQGGGLPKKTVMKGKLDITWQVTED